MKHLWIEAMILLGAALMAWNVFQYVRFLRDVNARGDWKEEAKIIRLPIVLLILFLCGYLAVGLFGQPDLVMAAILLGGSVFVFVMLLLMRRILSRIQLHEHLQAEMEAAKKASEAKSRFLSNMSHDLRTPLNAIIGYTALANHENVSPAQTQAYLAKIDTAGHQLLETINDVLEMSRIESGKLELTLERVCLEDVLSQVRDLVAPQMEQKHIDFVRQWDPERTYVLCDRGQLSRALMNLLSNACKFTPEGGRVTLAMTVAERQEDAVVTDFLVQDTGIGMSPEFAQRLFTPFERERTSTISKIQGTGLGMAITKSFVDRMGGTIEVDTRQGQGTAIAMRLTFSPAQAEEKAAAEAPCPHGDLCGIRLLLAEDNPVNQEIAVMLLTHEGFQVDCVPDGQAAVDAVTQTAPGTYDAVLMDIQMPVLDGYGATRAIRALDDPIRSRIPIVAMTANAFQEDQQAAADASMQGHIAKPLDKDVMLDTLRHVLQR